MAQRKLFLICGLNRLTVRVAKALLETGASVVVLRGEDEGQGLAEALPSSVRVLVTNPVKYEQALTEACVQDAACLLALSDGDLENLRAGVAAQAIAAHTPVVIRTFDPVFADQMESGLNIRRAYSVSALAAPAFIAAATGSDVLETLRLGTGEVPICRVTVRDGSSLVGLSAAALKADHGCALLARSTEGTGWRDEADGEVTHRVKAGDEILVGGLLLDVLRLCSRNAGWLSPTRIALRVKLPIMQKPGMKKADRDRPLTLLPLLGAVLGVVLVAAVFVFAHALRLRLIDALYFVITTATTTGYGDYSLKDGPDWLKLFGCAVMLAGGALFGVLFSTLAASATAERSGEVAARRARRMRNHVVVAGLGNVGYRVAQYLTDLGLAVVVLDRAPNPRFTSSLSAPVLPADVRQPEAMDRVAIDRALALISCTSDDLANVQACLHARRCSPGIVTVARVADDLLAERLTQAFRISRSLSASQSATGAFVGAALDERALRPVEIGGLHLLAYRLVLQDSLGEDVIQAWRARGIRFLACRTPDGTLAAPGTVRGAVAAGSELILCGPSAAILATAD